MISIYKCGGGGKLYANPLREIQSKASFYQQKFSLYPVLFFYGVGNGILLKILFQNPIHKVIVVFEKELEILWHILHLLDFSKELGEKRLCFHPANLSNDDLDALCEGLNVFAKIYRLEFSCAFYEKFGEDFARLDKALTEAFYKSTLRFGNDIDDALMGLENFTHNLPKMLTHPSLKSLTKAYKKRYETVIIVSTGPSLTKQIPLLREVQERALIFAADSAYAILARAGVRADFVFMVERTDFTAEFFNNDFKEMDAGVLFICAAVVHPNALAYLEKTGRSYMLVPRNYDFAYYCDFKDFGYATDCISVAHMAFELACALEFKNIIFIGQDLAFDEEGNSHPKDYLHRADFESGERAIKTLAYGGEGWVRTHGLWLLFKQILELFIARAQKEGIKIYNATEGGVRIQGAVEKPFAECCAELLGGEIAKPLPFLEVAEDEKQSEWLLKAYAKVYLAVRKCEAMQAELGELFANLELENLEFEALKILSGKLDALKENILKNGALLEVLRPSLHEFELEFMRIFVFKPSSEEEKREKILAMIRLYLQWLDLSLNSIKRQKLALLENIRPLEQALKKRNFFSKITKWKEKVAKI